MCFHQTFGFANVPFFFEAISWVQRLELNQLPPGYEPDELPMLYSAIKKGAPLFLLTKASDLSAHWEVNPTLFVTILLSACVIKRIGYY